MIHKMIFIRTLVVLPDNQLSHQLHQEVLKELEQRGEFMVFRFVKLK